MKPAIILVVALLFTSLSSARPARRGISGRLNKQEARIRAGEKSGKLTTEEAQTLREQGNAIRQERREMVKDNGGKLTKEQRQELREDLKSQSKAIKAEKSDENKVPVSQ